MNEVLEELLRTGVVSDGDSTYPLDWNIDRSEGELIQRAVGAAAPRISVEVGMAYGVSSLFICEALAKFAPGAKHIVFDPAQSSFYKGIGRRNLQCAGYGGMVDLREIGSEIGLPQLLAQGTQIQFGFIDGFHTFDHTLIDFFFINKMLQVGGIFAIDDTDWPSVRKVVDHVLTYPCYRLFGDNAVVPVGTARTRVRRRLAEATGLRMFRRHWDVTPPTCMAFEKIAPDDRPWNWHQTF